jgi:hypothetical protein
MPPTAALRGSPMLQERTLRRPKRLSGARALDQKTQPYERFFSAFVMPFVLRNELSAVERHSPVVPTAVEGSLLLSTSAAANFNSLSGDFSTPTASQTPSHPRKDAKGGPAGRGSCRRTSQACSISLIEAELRPAQAGRRAHLGYLLSAENQMHSGRASLGPGRPPTTG